MRKSLMILFLFSNFVILSQTFEGLSYELNDSNYVIVKLDSLDKKYELVYYLDQLISECELIKSLDYYISHGKKKSWYLSGELKTIENYWEGGINGKLQKFHKNGKIQREDFYKEGKLINGKCFDQYGQEVEYCNYYSPLKLPGNSKESYLKIIYEKMKYPKEARKKGEEGFVFTSVLISKTGSVEEVEILNPFSESIDEEIFRVLFDLPNFTPLKIEGIPTNTRVILPFNFKLKN